MPSPVKAATLDCIWRISHDMYTKAVLSIAEINGLEKKLSVTEIMDIYDDFVRPKRILRSVLEGDEKYRRR